MAPRLELVTGKGGVGKTTLCAALALDAARNGQRPLVVELSRRASLTSVFGKELGHEARDMGHGVHALSVDVEEALVGYLATHLRVRSVARKIIGSRALSGFLDAAPAVAEVATYHYLASLLAEEERGTPLWDPIFVDLDATGHALMFLGLPDVLDGLLGQSPLRGLVETFSEVLRDPEQTALHLVTLPRELPVEETEELSARLRAEERVALGELFVNRMPEPLIPEDLAGAVDALGALDDPATSADLALLEREARHRARAEAHLERLRALPHRLTTLPALPPGFSFADLADLGALARRRAR